MSGENGRRGGGRAKDPLTIVPPLECGGSKWASQKNKDEVGSVGKKRNLMSGIEMRNSVASNALIRKRETKKVVVNVKRKWRQWNW